MNMYASSVSNFASKFSSTQLNVKNYILSTSKHRNIDRQFRGEISNTPKPSEPQISVAGVTYLDQLVTCIFAVDRIYFKETKVAKVIVY